MSEQYSIVPLVSVVIPCFNCEGSIERAVKSVLNQTYSNLELLLIDNNSTDATLQVLKGLEARHSMHIRVYTEKIKGACAARNKGLEHSSGIWIQFLDADDELLPTKIESQMQLAMANSTDIVVSDYFKVSAKLSKGAPKKVTVADDPWEGVINSTLGVTSALLWRKEKVIAVNGWNTALSSSQEYDLLFRILTQGASLSIAHQANTVVYALPDSVSRGTSREKLIQILYNRYDLRSRIYAFLNAKGLLNPAYKKQLDTYLYYHLLLISELNMPYFKEKVKAKSFDDLGFLEKAKAFLNFIRHSSKRKYGYSNKLLKLAEWQYFFCKNLHLLRF